MPETGAAGFTRLDGIVLFAYFIGITAFGLWIARRIKSAGGYFLGERKLGWWIMVGQAFGTGTHAEQPVAQVGATYSLGFATIWYQWKNMLITPFYWLLAPWYRRSERTTIGEIIEDRFGRLLAFVYTLFAILYFVFNQGAMLKGAGKMISVATGQAISPDGVVIAMTAAFILYSFFGGLLASAYTDFVQSFLIILLSFLLIPIGLSVVGGFSGMRASLEGQEVEYFRLYSAVSGLGAFTIAMLAINGLVGIVAQPHVLTMCATGRTERAGRVGQTYGAMVKRFCTIGWALTGLIVAALLIQTGQGPLADPEDAFGYACRVLLAPGLTGLIVACVLAANMSTCSNFMVNTGALFTRNLFQRYIKADATDHQLLWTGRVSGLTLTLLGVLFGIYVKEVLHAFLFTETIAALMGVMFLGGVLWRRTNRWGAWAATLSAFGVYWFLNYLMSCRPLDGSEAYTALWPAWKDFWAAYSAGNLGAFWETGAWKLVYRWQPGPFGGAMLVSFPLMVVVSLLTPPEDPKRIEAFFDNQMRSTDEEALPDGAPKPLAKDRGEDLILLDLTGWFKAERWHNFWFRYREDIVGFVLAWAAVGLMILTAWGIMQIGK